MELAIISLFLVDRPSINLKSIRFLSAGKAERSRKTLHVHPFDDVSESLGFVWRSFDRLPKPWHLIVLP